MDLFKFTGNYWNVVVASIITNLIIVYGMILLILPGIIFGCKLAFTPFLVVDLRMNAFKAIKTSWQMTKGHAYKIFFINLLIIIPIFLCWTPIASAISESSFWFIPFLLIILIIILIGLALASLYHFIVISEDLSGGNNIDNTID
ncbi:MAG: hypothetical protein P9X24_10455 [Candidatus Hatepunaea meridiana]|nr:hypothetical protein [Candidatus Hatepunaea meridiana]